MPENSVFKELIAFSYTNVDSTFQVQLQANDGMTVPKFLQIVMHPDQPGYTMNAHGLVILPD